MNKINVGCGWECREGWLNVDNTQKPQKVNYPIISMDATVTWPYEDNYFEAVLSEHMIEHLPQSKGFFFLKEAYRTLKVNGVIRISCPERKFAEDLAGKDSHPYVIEYARKIFKREAQNGDANRIANRTLKEQGHVWVPYAHELVNQIKKAGFDNVEVMEFGVSKYDVFNGIELEEGYGSDIRKWESVCIEGIKLK